MCATTDTPTLIAGLALALHLMDEQTFKRHSLRAAVASISPSFARKLRDDRTPRVCFKSRPMDLFGAVCAAKMYWGKDAIANQLLGSLKCGSLNKESVSFIEDGQHNSKFIWVSFSKGELHVG